MSETTIVDAYGRPVVFQRRPAGRTGSVASGSLITHGRYYYEKPPELLTPRERAETYRLMSSTDSYIAESLRSNNLPLSSTATWTVVPGNPTPEGEEPSPEQAKSQFQADLIAANLYSQQSEEFDWQYWQMNSFSQRLREVLKFLEHGYALFWKKWKTVDQYRVYDRLLWLEPESIWEWDFAGDDTLRGVFRQYQRPDGTWASDEYLPAEELCLYCWDVVGTRLEGNPLLRSMFGPWKRKEFLNRCKMMAAQRAGVGLPWARRDSDQDGVDEKDLNDRIEKFMQSSMGQGIEHGYISVPNPTVEFNYLRQDPANLNVFDDLVQDENESIGHSGSTNASLLGETGQGNRALGEVQQEQLFILTAAIGQIVAEQDVQGVINVKGPVQDLLEENFADFGKLPEVTVTDIDPRERAKDLRLLYEGMSAGAVEKRPSVERLVLKRLNFNISDEVLDKEDEEREQRRQEMIDAREAAIDPTKQKDNDPRRGGRGDQNNNDIERRRNVTVAAESRRLASRRLLSMQLAGNLPAMSEAEARERGMSRSPTEFEAAVISFGEVSTLFTNGSDVMAGVMRGVWRDQIADIIGRGRSGKITHTTLVGFRRSRPKGVKKQERRVRDQFLRIAQVGSSHARNEMDRQQDLVAAESEILATFTTRVPKGGKLPSDVGPKVTAATQDLLDDLSGEAALSAEMSVDSIWARLVEATRQGFLEETANGLEGEDLWNAIDARLTGISERGVGDSARRLTTTAYNEGRSFEIQDDDTTQWAVRLELLDSRTCQPCKGLDGEMFLVGSAEYEANIPPAHCEGGTLCRGIMVPLIPDVAELIGI